MKRTKKRKKLQKELANAMNNNIKWGVELADARGIIRMIINSYNHEERFTFEKDLAKAEAFLKEQL